MSEGRLVNDWLSAYLEYTAEQESPESLHLWTALSVISASVRRKVYLDLEHGKVYPNLYVIIVAESARVRKSTAMAIGRDILIEAIPDIRIMRDSMTSQGLIKSMNHKTQLIKKDENGKETISEELRSDVAIFADEMANLFSYERTRASQMVIFLTRTYECPSLYDHTTVRDSTVRLHNLYPILLGGTDPHNLKVLPEDAVGGLTGRLIWVVEARRRANNPGWKRDERKVLARKLLREYLIHDLQRITHLEGEIKVDQEAMILYDNWYDELSKRDSKDPETDAFYQRCHTTAQRLAIVLSLSQSDNLIITPKHMLRGIELIEQQLPEVKRVTLWSGSSQYQQLRAKLIDYLQKSKGVATKSNLLKHMGILEKEFMDVLNTLVIDGTIKEPRLIKRQLAVELTDEGFKRSTRTQPTTET